MDIQELIQLLIVYFCIHYYIFEKLNNTFMYYLAEID